MKYVFISQNIVFSFLLSLSLLIVACGASAASVPVGDRAALAVEETPVASIGQAPIDPDIAKSAQEAKQQAQACPNVETALLQLIEATKTNTPTQLPQLTIQEDRVQVVLVLESEDTSFLENYEVEVGTQSGNEVQAFVTITHICDLANDQQIQAIRVPATVLSQ
ncbi:MAG: hypothetical protein GFH25_541218n19 [Chloroflexi bacterium AL-N10]|nr:hypothetical protein [Chloroflexi bacterium AL-N1]NOK69881.1 hypothetical protein [Chloroflexi bacterium AL-N10]NOK73822.1 hypothetical protein [Chloroflexi bacterium AL-N5]NOK91614.1 hypothetical protein [Chloroflexi bacterium AL-N15]